MQNPATSDSSFQKFLENLQKDNNSATQSLQSNTDREVAGKTSNDQKEQLKNIGKKLTDIKSVLTGKNLNFNVEPLVQVGENNTELLQKSLEELALIRKLTEGSVEFDKKLAGYRNTSGREVQSKVSGKIAGVGGVIDFETARDFTSGQGKRAQEANAVNLKTIDYVPGKSVSKAVKGLKADTEIDTEVNDKLKEKTQFQGFGKEIISGLKFFITEGLSEKEGYGVFQKPPKEVVKKERETKVTGGLGSDNPAPVKSEVIINKSTKVAVEKERESKVTGGIGADNPVSLKADLLTKDVVIDNNKKVNKKEREVKVTGGKGAVKPVSINPESDNIISAPEAIAKGTKEDIEVSKQLLNTTIEQLNVLKEIKEALVPKTPRELIEQKSAPSATVEPNKGLELPGLPDIPRFKPKAGLPPAPSAALAAGVMGGVAVGGAAATYAATGLLAAQTEHRKAYSAEQDKTGMLSAMSGDTGLAANILDANQGQSPEAVRAAQQKEQEQLKNAPWYTRMLGVGKASYLKENAPKLAPVTPNTKSTIPESIKPKDLSVTPKETVTGKKVEPKTGESSQINNVTPTKSAGGGQITDPNAPGYNADAAEYQRDKQSILAKTTNVIPMKGVPVGAEVARTSTENADMGREAGKSGGNNTIVSNNVSSNNTTKFVPMKPSPRPQSQGSALDRYQDRVTVY